MAEFILKDKVNKLNIENNFIIVSRATSSEEIGNDMHYGTKEILNKNNIPYTKHFATKLKTEDYDSYDYFICMDDNNLMNLLRIFGDDKDSKVIKLNKLDVKDPWYTGNFEETYKDISIGINRLIKELYEKG